MIHQLKGQPLRLYKYLSLVFTTVLWACMIIDDYALWQQYWAEHWLGYLGTWAAYFLIYFVGFSLTYWSLAIGYLLLYKKVTS